MAIQTTHGTVTDGTEVLRLTPSHIVDQITRVLPLIKFEVHQEGSQCTWIRVQLGA